MAGLRQRDSKHPMDEPLPVILAHPLRDEFPALLAGWLAGEIETLVVGAPVVGGPAVPFDAVGRRGRDVDLHAGKRREEGADRVARVDRPDTRLEQRAGLREERGYRIGGDGPRAGLIALHGLRDFTGGWSIVR